MAMCKVKGAIFIIQRKKLCISSPGFLCQYQNNTYSDFLTLRYIKHENKTLDKRSSQKLYVSKHKQLYKHLKYSKFIVHMSQVASKSSISVFQNLLVLVLRFNTHIQLMVLFSFWQIYCMVKFYHSHQPNFQLQQQLFSAVKEKNLSKAQQARLPARNQTADKVINKLKKKLNIQQLKIKTVFSGVNRHQTRPERRVNTRRPFIWWTETRF